MDKRVRLSGIGTVLDTQPTLEQKGVHSRERAATAGGLHAE